MSGHGIYVASRTKHAGFWRALRDQRAPRVPIISSWIRVEEKLDPVGYAQLWTSNITEASDAAVTLVYIQNGDWPLKGGLVEVGAALAHNRKVVVCSYVPDDLGSWTMHPNVEFVNDLSKAIDRAVLIERVDR